VLTAALLNPAASALSSAYERQKAAVMEGYLVEAPKAVWLRQGDKRSQVIIRAANRAPGRELRLRDASFYVYALDARGALRFTRRIDAEEARLGRGEWRLERAREGAPGAAAVRYDTLSLPSNLDPKTALAQDATAQGASFWSLPGAIAATERAGFSAVAFRLQLQQLLATPLMYAGMAVLAAAFSLRLWRSGGLPQLGGAAVGLGFAFFFVSQLCAALGRYEVIPPFLAAWAPPLLALLSGVTLVLYTEDG
jgi:lipopolysaccharide export system permease protein